MRRRNVIALAGTAVGLAAGVVAERSILERKRRNDPEGGERFGKRRGVRPRTIELPDGARIFVEEAGPEVPRGAVFVHGSALRTDLWYYQLQGIGDHRCVFYDLRGHGLSQPKGDSDFSIRTLGRDLEAVVDDAGLEEVVIVGHSVGGMIALELCCERPDLLGGRVKGVVLVNTTYRPAAETLTGGAVVANLERLVRRPLDALGKRADYVSNLRRIIRPSDAVFWAVAAAAFGPSASAKHIDFTYDMLSETPTDVIFDLIKCYRDFDVRDAVADITVPALVIAGAHDRLTVVKASEYLAEHLPKAELRVFEGCGHMTMLERHREFNKVLEAFLDDTLGRPRRQEGTA